MATFFGQPNRKKDWPATRPGRAAARPMRRIEALARRCLGNGFAWLYFAAGEFPQSRQRAAGWALPDQEVPFEFHHGDRDLHARRLVRLRSNVALNSTG